MSKTAGGSGLLQRAQRNWRKLIQVGSWLFATTSAFVAPPPVDIGAGDEKYAVKFATLAIAFLVGLLLVPLKKFHKARFAGGWAVVAAVLFLAGVAALVEYGAQQARLTADLGGTRVVIGDRASLTGLGKQYVQRFPFLTDAEILARTGGKPEWVWQEDAIHQSALRMYVLYVATVVGLAAAIICLLQVWELAGG